MSEQHTSEGEWASDGTGYRPANTASGAIPGNAFVASGVTRGEHGQPVSRDWRRAQGTKSIDAQMEASMDPSTGTARFVGGVSAESHPAEWLAQHGIQAVSERTGEPVAPSPAQARMLVQAYLNNMAMNSGYEGAAMSFSVNDNSLPPHLARVRGRVVV